MTLSQDDRGELVSRVERRLDGRGVSRAAIQEAVDRVLEKLALPLESTGVSETLFAVKAQSMPDLASRVKRKLSASGIEARDSAVATVGRHTVMTLRAPVSSRAQLETIANELGAELRVMDESELRA
jgi:hypothetical protein